MNFVFDLDNTILFSEVDKDGNYIMIGASLEIVSKINYLYKKGNIIILWTGRHWNHLEITKRQLDSLYLKYHTLIMGKPYADYYIDDRAINPDEFRKLNLTND